MYAFEKLETENGSNNRVVGSIPFKALGLQTHAHRHARHAVISAALLPFVLSIA